MIDHCFDLKSLSICLNNVVIAAQQAQFLTCKGDEPDAAFRLIVCCLHHPCHFQGGRHSAGVVIYSGCYDHGIVAIHHNAVVMPAHQDVSVRSNGSGNGGYYIMYLSSGLGKGFKVCVTNSEADELIPQPVRHGQTVVGIGVTGSKILHLLQKPSDAVRIDCCQQAAKIHSGRTGCGQ